MFGQRALEKNGGELLREIVDEKSADINVFLRCLHKNLAIDGESLSLKDENFDVDPEWNLPTLLRLAQKYQVESVARACDNFLQTANLE